ncbi:MAG TPA: TlpA family protein disulfide reductase [Thermomicrobiales bacterium]|jgi:peroxiredoxin|nr:TlpA family protein disulfide reductase [Thermomicrobiales bacterium]
MIPLAVAIVALSMLVPIGALVARAWADQRRIVARIDAFVAAPTPDDRRAALLDALKGERAPGIDLPDLDGGRLSLDMLLARARPLLLIFAEPRCGPCYELLPDIGGWQRVYGDRLTIALVSSGTPDHNRAMTGEYGISPVLLQVEREIVEAYGLIQAPAAVLVQPDGQVAAGPRYGTRAIRQLVAETLGLVLPEAPQREVQVAGVGQSAPALRRPDLDGNVIDLAAFRGAPTLLLFWSPGCSYCQGLLPEIKAFERTLGQLRMVIVSRGPAGLNQEAGFVSPMVLDDDLAIAQSFGASGTPAAVLIDGRGVVAAPVARGATGLRGVMHALRSLDSSASVAD